MSRPPRDGACTEQAGGPREDETQGAVRFNGGRPAGRRAQLDQHAPSVDLSL